MGIYKNRRQFSSRLNNQALREKIKKLNYDNQALYYKWKSSEIKRKNQVACLLRALNEHLRRFELSERPQRSRRVSFVIDQNHSKKSN